MTSTLERARLIAPMHLAQAKRSLALANDVRFSLDMEALDMSLLFESNKSAFSPQNLQEKSRVLQRTLLHGAHSDDGGQ